MGPTSSIASAVAAATAIAATAVQAHQYVILPAPTWTSSDHGVWHLPLAFLEGQNFTTHDDFPGFLAENGYKSLRDFMDTGNYTITSAGANFDCGHTVLNGSSVQPIPANFRSTGYTHDGPCEIWLDNTRIYANDNCHEAVSGKDTAVDYSSCSGLCTLRWYWLGVRYLKKRYSWQVYKNCVLLSTDA